MRIDGYEVNNGHVVAVFISDKKRNMKQHKYEPARPHGEWIPCSERLPEKFGAYFVTTEEGKVFEYGYNTLTVHLKKWSFCRKEIVAWMPLPEPYKIGGKANDR